MAVGYFGDVIFSVSDDKVLSFKDLKLTAAGSRGEHKRIGKKPQLEFLGPGAKKLSFTIVLDAAYGVSPREQIDILNDYAEKGTICVLVVGSRKIGDRWMTTNVSSSWNRIMNGGELLKASVNISLEEYENEPLEIVSTVAPIKQVIEENQGTTYTVAAGDCLWNIAKEFYGSGAKYTIIYNANKGIIKNPSLIYPGQVLTIPKA